MGNVSVCARLQSPNRRETADVHSDRKFPYAARSTCSHQPLGHHSARSAQAEKTLHLCIMWSLFSVAIGSTARATNSCISLLTQMPADKTEWELMVIRENQKALTVTISSALSRALTLQSGLPGLNTRIQLFNFLPPPLPVGSRKLGLQHLLVPGLQHPFSSIKVLKEILALHDHACRAAACALPRNAVPSWLIAPPQVPFPA